MKIYRYLGQLVIATGPSHLYRNSTPMRAGSHVSAIVGKLLSRGTPILCLIALIILTTGATQSLPPLSRARSATAALAHRSGRPCFENPDLQYEVFPANAQGFDAIAKPYRPKAVVSFIVEAPVDSKHQNRPPPGV
jgi:hypothetical protein